MNTRSSKRSSRSSSSKQTKSKSKESPKPKSSPKKTPSKAKKAEEETYIVEEILEKKKIKGRYLYKVKWVGYPLDQCTWEPAKNLDNVRYMVNEFNKEHRQEEDDESDKEDNEEGESEGEEEEEEEEREAKSPKKATKKEKTETKTLEKKTANGKRNLTSIKKSERSPSPQKKAKGESREIEVKSASKRGRPVKLRLIPDKIIHAKQTTGGLIFTIQWKPLKDGTVPPHSYLNNTELRKYDKDLLLDYYESKLKFVKSPATKTKENGSEGSNLSDKGDENKSPFRSPLKSPPSQASNKNASVNKDEEEAVSNLINPIKGIESSTQNEILDPQNMIQNEGQTIFADLGSNTLPEIRDLTLDAHLRIYDQSNPEGVDQASIRAQDTENTNLDLQIDSPKEISDI